jgi:PleD family two-component response regulator
VTVSIGVATWRAGLAALPELLVQRADAALYQAKNAGRNRSVSAPAG